MRKTFLLLSLLLSLTGTQMKAETLTEDFDNLTVNSDYKTLSNGWFVQGSEYIYSSPDYYYYGLGTDQDYRAFSGKSLYSMSGSSAKNAYIIVPTKLTGELTFKYRAACSSRVSYTPMVRILQVTEDNGTYTVGSAIATLNPTKGGGWADASIDLGVDGKMIAIQLFRSYIDNFSAEIFDEGAEVKAFAISAFSTTTPSVTTDADGNYAASFSVTVENKGNADITAADNATVSVLNSTKAVLATSDPIELAAGESKEVAVSVEASATADGTVTFYARENFSDKEFAASADVDVQLAGARFAINTDGSAQDFGFVAQNTSSEKTFTITNSGNADLSVTISAPAGFTAEEALTVAAGQSAALSVALNTAEAGLKSGDVVFTSNAKDTPTFTIPANGYVYADGVEHVDFSTLPDGWVLSGNYTIADGLAKATYNPSANASNTLTTNAIKIENSNPLAIRGRLDTSYGELTVKGSADGGTTWTYTKDITTFTQDSFTTIELADIPADVNKLQFVAYYASIDDVAGFVYDQNAPVMEVTLNGTAVESPFADDFGKVTASVTHTYTVTNTGTGTLNVSISSSDDTNFTVAPASLQVVKGEPKTFDVTFNFTEGNFGEKEATITLTPDGLSELSIDVKANAKDPNLWEEDFEEGTLPATWNNEGNWSVTKPTASGSNGTYMATISSYGNPKYLVTPRLEAKTGDQLTFEIGMQYDDEPLTIEYSNDDQQTWSKIEAGNDSYTESATLTFTAPADGFYNLRFTGTYAMIDNFTGFKLAMKEHELIIVSQDTPTTGKQFEQYTATVTVKELVGKQENAIATLYIDGNPVATDEQTVNANGQATFKLTNTLEIAGSYLPYIEITYADGLTLTTDMFDLTIAQAYTLDETEEPADIEYGTYPGILVNYTAKAGWNSVALPFNVTDLSVFGEGTKAYAFASLENGKFSFEAVSQLEAGSPYIIQIATPAAAPLTFRNVEIPYYAHTAQYVKQGDATFYATYAPMAEGTLTGMYGVSNALGDLVRVGANATMKGYRGYFEVTGESASSLAVEFIDNGTVTTINAAELTKQLQGEVYDLSGRKMNTAQPLCPGVYVKDGKKFVVR